MKKCFILFAVFAAATLLSVPCAYSVDCPSDPPHNSPPYSWHFDPGGSALTWTFLAPISDTHGSFSDDLNGSVWHIEFTFRRHSGNSFTTYPFIVSLEGQTIAGEFEITDDEYYRFDIHLQEPIEIMSFWKYYLTNTNGSIFFDMSISEETAAQSHPDVYPATWTSRPAEEVRQVDHTEIIITATPIPTLTNYGLIVLGALLVGSSILLIRRRRSIRV